MSITTGLTVQQPFSRVDTVLTGEHRTPMWVLPVDGAGRLPRGVLPAGRRGRMVPTPGFFLTGERNTFTFVQLWSANGRGD